MLQYDVGNLPEVDERRSAVRYPTIARARIVCAEPLVEFECIIRNISETGALLVMPDATRVPETFRLISVYHPDMPCRVAWRTERRLGVQFADQPIRPIGG